MEKGVQCQGCAYYGRLKRGQADMQKLGSIPIFIIVAAVAAWSHSALAKGDKSTSNLAKNTATGKHYNETTLTPYKPKPPVTQQKPTKKSGNTGKDPNSHPNPNSTGAGEGKDPNSHPNPNSTGAGEGKASGGNPNSTPKLTPDKVEAGGENIRR
jgi:hypothetical protein